MAVRLNRDSRLKLLAVQWRSSSGFHRPDNNWRERAGKSFDHASSCFDHAFRVRRVAVWSSRA
jgi:hypothetical protein